MRPESKNALAIAMIFLSVPGLLLKVIKRQLPDGIFLDNALHLFLDDNKEPGMISMLFGVFMFFIEQLLPSGRASWF